MQLVSFCIENFRSIVNTGWINLSTDGVTALVGQNESGKTAVLEALSQTLSTRIAQADDFRLGGDSPVIRISVRYTRPEIEQALDEVSDADIRTLLGELIYAELERPFIWRFGVKPSVKDPKTNVADYNVEVPDVRGQLFMLAESANPPLQSKAAEATTSESPAPSSPTEEIEALKVKISSALTQFRNGLFDASPTIVLFDEDSGLLPNTININDELDLASEVGEQAARNFLSIAEIDLAALVKSDTRTRAGILKAANKKISDDFLAFWSQTIGEKVLLQLECSIHQHPFGHEKAGKSYLEFLITDAAAPLYPGQRSRGTRWFISFFLQLRASSLDNDNLFFLLDEPGANLHEKAQGDVLTLIEKIRANTGIIYSTHSPHLMNEKSFHRILAVERDPTAQGHPTRIIGAHSLGAASRDTLSPIFTMMGVCLSRQTAIKQHNNVILEEVSCHYYLRAFWKLTGCIQEVHFLAATGTSNVPMYAQLFLGWGLDFLVVVDDEGSGRKVYNELKRDLFLDDAKWASRRMLKLPDCEGIEDIFEAQDYTTHVLESPEKVLGMGNARWAKKNGVSKALHALKFLQKVERGEIELKDLHAETQRRSRNLVTEISNRLEAY